MERKLHRLSVNTGECYTCMDEVTCVCITVSNTEIHGFVVQNVRKQWKLNTAAEAPPDRTVLHTDAAVAPSLLYSVGVQRVVAGGTAAAAAAAAPQAVGEGGKKRNDRAIASN